MFNIKLVTLVYLMPIIHAIAQSTTNYFPPETINPGSLRLVYLLVAIIIIFSKNKLAPKKLLVLTLFFIVYNLILVLINENIITPLINLIRLSIPLMILFVGYTVIDNNYKLNNLFKAYLIALLILIINFIVANIYELGGSTYVEASFYIGGAGVGVANELAVLIICAITFIIYNHEKKWKITAIILTIIGMIVILISLRRGAFIIIAGSLVVFMIISSYRYSIIKYALLFCTIMLVLFPIYGNLLMQRYEARIDNRAGSLANYEVEARYSEFYIVPETLTREGLAAWLIGTHNLNSEEYFGGRPLHVGYLSILHGSGLIGLALYFIYMWFIFYKGHTYYIRSPIPNRNRLIYKLFLILILSIFIYLLTSRLHGFDVTFLAYMMLGALLKNLKMESICKLQRDENTIHF